MIKLTERILQKFPGFPRRLSNPGSTLGSIYKRLRDFRLDAFLKSRQLLIYTMSEGPTPKLDDPNLLLAVKGADVFLDTAIRWIEGDENSASDNQRGFAAGMFALMKAGARSVNVAAHAAKSFGDAKSMTLENAIRGSGDLGAVAFTAWGMRVIDRQNVRIFVDNLKARDFEPGPPFQIQARPSLTEEGKIRMYARPGESENLYELVKIGRPPSDDRKERVKLVWKCMTKKMSDSDILELFKARDIEVKPHTLKKYKIDARRANKKRNY